MNQPKRLLRIEDYPFVALEKLQTESDVIDLSMGSPDLDPPQSVIEALHEALKNTPYKYPTTKGMYALREAIAQFYYKRFKVELDVERQVLPLLGSKEGIAHLPLSVCDCGDVVLVPRPGYPAYKRAAALATDKVKEFILEEGNFLPNLKDLQQDLKTAKLWYLNYPNNPTGQVAPLDFLAECVDLARRYSVVVAHDAAYSELYYGNEPPCSILQIEGAKEIAVEFNSLTKTYNLAGLRVGYVVGNESLIENLYKLKSTIDSGIFECLQIGAVAALNVADEWHENLRRIYRQRLDVVLKELSKTDAFEVYPPKATFYIWLKLKTGEGSVSFVTRLFTDKGVLLTPSEAFGISGYLRLALTQPTEQLKIAVARILDFVKN